MTDQEQLRNAFDLNNNFACGAIILAKAIDAAGTQLSGGFDNPDATENARAEFIAHLRCAEAHFMGFFDLASDREAMIHPVSDAPLVNGPKEVISQ